jgi:serine/threonine protein kinase
VAIIIIENGKQKGKSLSLAGQELVIFGRESLCQVSFHDLNASRKHFSIEMQEGRYVLLDQQSHNGTFLNGKRVDNAQLNYGDQIQAGATFFTFAKEEEALGSGLYGRTLGGYTIERRLGGGGMGAVYLARQKSMNRDVAFKILSSRLAKVPSHVERFQVEAHSMGRLNHPCLVQVYDIGSEGGLYFFAMEYLSGGSLADLLSRTGRLSYLAAIEVMRDVARGLSHAETHLIVHRDIKPQNIMFDGEGNGKICDFGIAVVRGKFIGGQHKVAGTPQYMAPEQAQGLPVDIRTDIYGLGCTLYCMLVGHPPFWGASSEEIMKKHCKEQAPRLETFVKDISQELLLLAERMMAKRPEDRPDNASDLIREIENCLKVEKARSRKQSESLKAYISADWPSVDSSMIEVIPEPTALGKDVLSVLVVEDEELIRTIVTDMCTQLGCSVVSAKDGYEALEKFDQGTFHLVLTDRRMPGMDGAELAIKIRARAPEVAIVMLTGMGMKMRATGEHPECVDLVLSKPISMIRLKRALELVF